MFKAETVFILIVVACAIILFVAIFSILKKKSKKSSKAGKSKTTGGGMPKADVVKETGVKLEKMQSKAPKINKEKLKKIEDESAKVQPVFSKDELESERIEQIQKEIQKDLSNQKRPQMFPGFNPQGFSFPMPQRPFPQQPIQNPEPDFQSMPISNEKSSSVSIPVEAKDEDKDFVEMLKKRGVVNQNQSFGESLIIKEAIDTPASKQAMKKKRQKWM